MLNFIIPRKQNGYKAHLIKVPALIIFLILITFINLVAKSSINAQNYNSTITPENLLIEHNKVRIENQLPEFKLNPLLMKSAQNKAEKMLETNCWSHYCPKGVEPWVFFDEAGYLYIYAGENLAEGFTNVNDLMNAWINSKTHRDNIIKEEYKEIGFGLANGMYQDIASNLIVVVHFGTQANLISSDLNQSQIKIISPKQDEIINNDYINVNGETTDISILELYNNGNYKGSPTILDGIFTFRIIDPDQGKNLISIKGVNSSNQNITSNVEVLVNKTILGNSSASITSGISLPFEITSTTQNIVNIAFILFFAFLFLIDFIVLTRTHVLNLNKSFSHYHFAILIIITFVILVGGFAGNIGVGIFQ